MNTECLLCRDEFIGIDGYCDIDCVRNGREANELHTECISDEWTIEAILALVFGTIATCLTISFGILGIKQRWCCKSNEEAKRRNMVYQQTVAMSPTKNY